MADDGQRQHCSLNPLGGAAMRQIRGRDQSAFARPQPQNPPVAEESHSAWTQFSGMPDHTGSPLALHDWLHSLDEADIPYNTNQGFHSFSSPPSADSRCSPLDGFSSPDFTGLELNPDGSDVGPTPFSLGQFDFSTLPDFSLPSDFHLPYTHQYDPSSQFSPSANLLMPTTDFSHPPPSCNYSSHVQPDFSRPPPSFLSEIPMFGHSAAADAHAQGLPDLFPIHNRQMLNSDRSFYGDDQLNSHSLDFDAADTLPTLLNSASGNIDVHLPTPSFPPYPVIADDILCPNAEILDGHGRSKTHGFEHTAPVHKKMVHQSSEPMCKGTSAEEGRAIYVDALRRLNSFGSAGPSYEPFRSGVQMQEELLLSAKKSSDRGPVNKPVARKEPPRMTYSDVAKAPKGKPSQAKTETLSSEKFESDFGPLRMHTENTAAPRFQRYTTAKRQSSHPRISGHQGKAADGIAANSRYGLDQFEDAVDLVRADGDSSSVENLLQMNQQHGAARRSSNSSMSSSTSAKDDSLFSSRPTVSGDSASSARYRETKDLSPNIKDSVQNHSVFSTSVPNSHSNEQQSTKSSSTSSSTSSASQGPKSERLFFDPKRIFQKSGGVGINKPHTNVCASNKSKPSEEKKKSDTDGGGKGETVLNNGKPNNTTSKAVTGTHRKADYINNDLREGASVINPSTSSTIGGSGHGAGSSNKRTNQTAALGRPGHCSKKQCSKDIAVQNGSSADKVKGGDSRNKRRGSEQQDDNSFLRNIDWDLVDEWMKYISDSSMNFARNSLSAVVTLMVYLLGIIMYLAVGAIHLIALGVGKLWTLVRIHIFKDQGPSAWSGFPSTAESPRRRFGLEENITLPSTGEEAMKRLLACKGKDPYSILGLKAEATDEDIKRYYRRQAVLVHPDKNQEPGAEEAFKILGHAFEKIGDPTKRKEYDVHIFEASEAEAAMREFSDLLTKLQEKVQEAANLMRCDYCGGKHRRIPVDRPWYSARFCDRCNLHHSAKEGDVWAESSMLGFLWHYYACMENNIYDITEWVSCQSENFKHMKANAHPVFYRIQTDGSRRHRQGQSGEADLEDFINRLFNKAQESGSGNASHPGWQFHNQQSGSGGAGTSAQPGWGGNASAPSANPGSSSKRSRRKKKRN